MDAGLLQSKQSLTNVELQNSIAKTLSASMSEEEAAAKSIEIMSSMGLSAAIEGEEAQTIKLTAEKLTQLVTSKKLSQAEAMEIAMRNGSTASINAQTMGAMPKWISKIKESTAAIKLQAVETGKWLLTNPTAWCVALTAALLVLNHVIQSNVKTLQEQKDLLDETNNNISNNNSEASELQSKKEENQQQISSLKNSDDPTDIAKVQKLETENVTLQQQLELLQLLNQQETKNAQQYTKDIINNTALITNLSKVLNDIQGFHFFQAVKDSDLNIYSFMNAVDKFREGDISGGFQKIGKGIETNINPLAAIISLLTPHKENEKSITEETQDQIDSVSDLRKQLAELESKKDSMDAGKYKKQHESIISKITTETKSLTGKVKELEEYQSNLDPDDAEYEQVQKVLDNYTASLTKTDDYNTFDKIINSEIYGSNKKELIDLANQGKLSENILEENYHNLWVLFDALGLSIDDVNEKLKGIQIDDSVLSFNKAWKNLDAPKDNSLSSLKSDLLELAEAGQLTEKTFMAAKGSDTFLEQLHMPAGKAVEEINKLINSEKQLASMRKGITSLSDNLAAKESSPDKEIDSSTLNSMPDELKKNKKEWKQYVETLGDASSSMSDVKKVTNELATAYINGSSFLTNLDKDNKEYYITQLKLMGVENAREIVNKKLRTSEEALNAKKQISNKLHKKFCELTWENISSSDQYTNASKRVQSELQNLYLQENIFQNNKLNLSQKITELQKYADVMGMTVLAASAEEAGDKAVKRAIKKGEISGLDTLSVQRVYNQGQLEYFKQHLFNVPGNNNGKSGIKVGKTGNSSKKETGENPDTQSEQTKSTETIDWVARRLEVLQSAIDLTKAKFENLFRFQAKKNNLNAQIKQTTKLLQAQEKVADRYAKKAANVSLSSNLKKKVKKGQIDGKLSELLKNYDEDTANKISKYQEYWDKSQDSKKSVQELKKSRKELMDQKDQLHVDRAEQKISTLDAKAEISNTAKEKNRLENKKIEQLKESYQYQIKIAEREKNSVKVTELRAKKEKEILEIKKQILQNTLDENGATRSYNDARYANAKTLAEKNAILDNDIESYRSDQQANETYYSQLVSNTQKKAKKSLGTNALMGSLASSQVAGKNKNKILDLIKKGNPIPDSILNRKNVKNHPDLLNKLIEYNNSLDDITKEVEKVQQDKDKADQETKTAIREKEIQKLQNNAEEAEANYNLSKIREDNAITAKEKNKQEENSRASLIEQYDYLKKIAETNGDIVEQQRLEEELQEKIAQSYQTEFHNIKAEYEKKTTLNEGNISSTQAEISALQAQGKAVSESFYGSLLNDTRYKKKLLIEEKNELEDKLASLEVGSDAWYEAIETLDNLDVSIIKCDEDTAQFTKTINEQKLALLSLKTAQIQSGIDHVSFLIDELSHKDLTKKESGGFTTEGLTVLSLYASQMQQNKDKLASVRASYDEFQKQVALGISNLSEEEIQAKNDDYMKQIQDIISANSALKDSMISLVKEGFEVQLDSLNELIDTRKKALQSEKNLYDYQRKVADQTKTITNIEKQMAALSGDDSEETRAKLQKLAVELDTAKQDLEDTEYDQWISDQEELLDSLSEDFEDFMENMLRDTDALIEQVIEAINQNGDIVSSTLSSLGYGNASTVSTIDNGDGTHTTTITDYNGNTTSLTFDQKGNVISSSKEADKKSVVLDILNNYAERRGYARNPVEALFLNAGYNNYLSEEAIEKLSSISGKSWTSADDQNEANAVYNWLKEIGFANGGVVGGNSYSGDRLWARVNSGESILTRKFTDLLPETLHTMNRFINLPSCNLPSLPVTNAQPALQMGNIDIHLDGSSVTDPKSFVDVFKNSREMQTAVQNATIGQIARSYSNSLNI
ncbi:MAG: hypothetical protein J5979_00315 [Lachnospiraceae bacterium]|nr:hypothetical protein [Lachnospiraceae bacterium]